MNITTNKFKPSDLLLRLSASFMWELLSPPATPRPQPSLRIPVTPANREWLRALRAAEAAAWEAPTQRP